MGWRDGYIAVDWGTTNRRAYAVDRRGCVHRRDRGRTRSPCRAPGRLSRGGGRDPGSPRRPADAAWPAWSDRIAAGARRLCSRPGRGAGRLPPEYAGSSRTNSGSCRGVSGRGGGRRRDARRRGAGARRGRGRAGRRPTALICHPGTHAKWIRVEGGRIACFRTMMTGELFGLLREHRILSAQLQGEVSADDPGFAWGLTAEALPLPCSASARDICSAKARRTGPPMRADC